MSKNTEATYLRLTQADRESVRDRAIDAAFGERRKAIIAEEETFAQECFEHLFPASVRKAANSLPEGWLRQDKCLRFSFSGMQTTLNCSAPVRVPSGQSYGCHRLGEISDDSLRGRFHQIQSAKDDLKKTESEASLKLFAMLSRFFTLGTLKEGWPDGERFYSHLKPRKGASVPAIQVADINKLLGIR